MLETESTLTTGESLRFVVDTDRPSYLDIYDRDVIVGQAVTLIDAAIRAIIPHPDGVLVLGGEQVGKVTRNDKGFWTYSAVTDPRDLDLVGVDEGSDWHATFARIESGRA